MCFGASQYIYATFCFLQLPRGTHPLQIPAQTKRQHFYWIAEMPFRPCKLAFSPDRLHTKHLILYTSERTLSTVSRINKFRVLIWRRSVYMCAPGKFAALSRRQQQTEPRKFAPASPCWVCSSAFARTQATHTIHARADLILALRNDQVQIPAARYTASPRSHMNEIYLMHL